ncbi:MAG TPA: type II toxin-antitoxin system VapC family toxin [Dehalococcoidia bacterium]|nr:type II toxin-antitoxin system VapC family toxin [Dehalococcoidia bacterium]
MTHPSRSSGSARGERHVAEARALRSSYYAGELAIVAPPLLPIEMLNVAARRWRLAEAALAEFADALDEIGFQSVQPTLTRVAYWTSRGLTAYDASYVALAEESEAPLITDDDLIVRVAGTVAVALGEAPA